MKIVLNENLRVRVSRGKPVLVYSTIGERANATGGSTVDVAELLRDRMNLAIEAVRPDQEKADTWVGLLEVQITMSV